MRDLLLSLGGRPGTPLKMGVEVVSPTPHSLLDPFILLLMLVEFGLTKLEEEDILFSLLSSF